MDYSKQIEAVFADICKRHFGKKMDSSTLEQLHKEIDEEFHAREIPAQVVALEWDPTTRFPKGSISVWQTLDISVS